MFSAAPWKRSPSARALVCASRCVGPSLPIKIYTKLCLVWNKQAGAAEDFTTSRGWLASKIPKQNKIQLASLQTEASLLFAAIAEQTFRCCATAPAPAPPPPRIMCWEDAEDVQGHRRAANQPGPCPSLSSAVWLCPCQPTSRSTRRGGPVRLPSGTRSRVGGGFSRGAEPQGSVLLAS